MKFNLNTEEEFNEALLIRDISKMMRANFDKRAAHLGLTRSQWDVIKILKKNPLINQSKLAAMLEIEQMSLVKLLDRLEKSSWIIRVKDKNDRRANKIELTDKAMHVAKEMRALAIRLRQEYLSSFSKKEHDDLLGCLKTIKSNLAKTRANP